MKEITITVKVADRPYRLKVNGDKEEMMRKAANEINEKTKEYANHYAFNDKQDLLAMTALHFALEAMDVGQVQSKNSSAAREKIRAIDEMLAKHIE